MTTNRGTGNGRIGLTPYLRVSGLIYENHGIVSDGEGGLSRLPSGKVLTKYTAGRLRNEALKKLTKQEIIDSFPDIVNNTMTRKQILRTIVQQGIY